MTQKDAGSFAAKRPPGEILDPQIAAAVREQTVKGEFTCHQAEQLAANLQVEMEKVGATLDLLEIRIASCQLGLFGYGPESRIVKPATSVLPDTENAIRQALVNGRLSCLAAWNIAGSSGQSRMAVSSACEALKIKIKPCQLGAF
jgi:hypothetical protein